MLVSLFAVVGLVCLPAAATRILAYLAAPRPGGRLRSTKIAIRDYRRLLKR